MEKEVSIAIDENGNIKTIYNDNIAKVIENLGNSSVKRASHVEPSTKTPNTWEVDLSPVGGPTVDGFKTRKEALDYEVDYLNKNVLKTN